MILIVKQSYEKFRINRIEGKDDIIDREPDEEDMAVIPAIELPGPIDPYVIRPWTMVPDSNFGTYYYNTETGM